MNFSSGFIPEEEEENAQRFFRSVWKIQRWKMLKNSLQIFRCIKYLSLSRLKYKKVGS